MQQFLTTFAASTVIKKLGFKPRHFDGVYLSVVEGRADKRSRWAEPIVFYDGFMLEYR